MHVHTCTEVHSVTHPVSMVVILTVKELYGHKGSPISCFGKRDKFLVCLLCVQVLSWMCWRRCKCVQFKSLLIISSLGLVRLSSAESILLLCSYETGSSFSTVNEVVEDAEPGTACAMATSFFECLSGREERRRFLNF